MPPKKKVIPRPEFFVTTVPVVRPCSRCAVWLAAGLSEGMHVQAEFTALDPTQTVQAVLLGLRLFAITRTGLVHLDDDRLRDERYSARFPQHRCGVVWESRLPGGDIRPVRDPLVPPY